MRSKWLDLFKVNWVNWTVEEFIEIAFIKIYFNHILFFVTMDIDVLKLNAKLSHFVLK